MKIILLVPVFLLLLKTAFGSTDVASQFSDCFTDKFSSGEFSEAFTMGILHTVGTKLIAYNVKGKKKLVKLKDPALLTFKIKGNGKHNLVSNLLNDSSFREDIVTCSKGNIIKEIQVESFESSVTYLIGTNLVVGFVEDSN